jgi:hypothetical protein
MSEVVVATEPNSTSKVDGISTAATTSSSRTGWSDALVKRPQATEGEGDTAVADTSHPLMPFAGMFPRSDPRVREWLEIIEARRRAGDDDGEVLSE